MRREEVSALSGVGVSWYTWLEQGRDINVSDQVVEAISTALRLNACERVYLYNLVGLQPTPGDRTASYTSCRHIEPYVDGWLPNPAFVTDRGLAVVAANRMAQVILGLTGPGQNYALDFFITATTRDRYPQRAESARRLVARLRAHVGRFADDPRLRTLVDCLYQKSDEFARLWDLHEVADETSGVEVLRHPAVGEIRLRFRILDFTDVPGLRLTLFLPASADDAGVKLAQLAGTGRQAEATERLRAGG